MKKIIIAVFIAEWMILISEISLGSPWYHIAITSFLILCCLHLIVRKFKKTEPEFYRLKSVFDNDPHNPDYTQWCDNRFLDLFKRLEAAQNTYGSGMKRYIEPYTYKNR